MKKSEQKKEVNEDEGKKEQVMESGEKIREEIEMENDSDNMQ